MDFISFFKLSLSKVGMNFSADYNYCELATAKVTKNHVMLRNVT